MTTCFLGARVHYNCNHFLKNTVFNINACDRIQHFMLMLTVGVFGAEVRLFGKFPIFSQTHSNFSGVLLRERRKLVFGITGVRENHLGRNFGQFWVSSTFWSHWSRFQSHWRPFCRCFCFREAFRATRAISVLELFRGYVQPFLVIQKPMSAIFDLLSLMEEVSEPMEVIVTLKFSMQD